jgi:ubiquitin C-terminal hydrolase
VSSGSTVSRAFGSLLRSFWRGEARSIDPVELKSALGAFAPQFSGNGAHDVHEFIATMIGVLHDSMNVGEGSSEEVIEDGIAAWAGHTGRNRSPIVDLFHGMVQMTFHCPACAENVLVFEPYVSLGLPLLQARATELTVRPRPQLTRDSLRKPME